MACVKEDFTNDILQKWYVLVLTVNRGFLQEVNKMDIIPYRSIQHKSHMNHIKSTKKQADQ